jgi:deoxyhypusine synthase
VEEDLIKCMGKTYLGEFQLNGKELRMKGQNRIGNMLVPNNNYCAFEDFMKPILTKMLQEQNENGVSWTPSKMIKRLGECINDESSVYYWCVHFSRACVSLNVIWPVFTSAMLTAHDVKLHSFRMGLIFVSMEATMVENIHCQTSTVLCVKLSIYI